MSGLMNRKPASDSTRTGGYTQLADVIASGVHEPAVEVVGKCVVRAGDGVGVAKLLGQQLVTAVLAHVEHGVQLAIDTYGDDALVSNRRCEVVAVVWNLIGVANHHPGRAEDAIELGLEHRRIGVVPGW